MCDTQVGVYYTINTPDFLDYIPGLEYIPALIISCDSTSFEIPVIIPRVYIRGNGVTL